MTTPIRIPVDSGSVDAVSALVDGPKRGGRSVAFLLAHGAGAPFDSEFMERIAHGLAARDFGVLRFQYPYMERARRDDRRRPPDRRPVLEAAHVRALATAREHFDVPVVPIGKSLGGRIGSYVAAADGACPGLAFLGYPLHPPGKPERLRDDHFPELDLPTLFLQGTRDNLCRLDLLAESLERFAGDTRVVEIEGGDHGFKVPRKYGGEGVPPYEALIDHVVAWVEQAIES